MKILTSIVPDGVWRLPEEQVAWLQRQFPALTIVDAPTPEQRMRELPDAEIAFLSRLQAHEFAVARSLRWIQSPAAGVGNLLFPELRRSPVVVTNARGINGEAIAEYVMAVTIAFNRQVPHAFQLKARHAWGKDDRPLAAYRTIAGQCMGIVGLGAIGGAVAAKAAALGMEVIAVRRRPDAPKPPGVTAVFPAERLDTLLARADVVVLATPLTGETGGLIGGAQLRQMKPDAILVNVARGRLVREDELAQELARGTIAGAALDVFVHEPLDPASPLWDLPNVILTPHTSAFRRDYWDMATQLFARNLARYLDGQPLANVVDKEAGY